MNFRYLSDDETASKIRISSSRNHSYICIKNQKYMFGILNENDYPYIEKQIRFNHKKVNLKTTIYYICKQIDTYSRYIPGVGRVYTYYYNPIIEITRSKYEDEYESIKISEAIGELFRDDIKVVSSTLTSYNSTNTTFPYEYSLSSIYPSYITASNTSTTY